VVALHVIASADPTHTGGTGTRRHRDTGTQRLGSTADRRIGDAATRRLGGSVDSLDWIDSMFYSTGFDFCPGRSRDLSRLHIANAVYPRTTRNVGNERAITSPFRYRLATDALSTRYGARAWCHAPHVLFIAPEIDSD
jgi:hypothetical protein